jgi:uncharacterized membrane protein YphA (DoxX/SURF4 family)
MGVPKMEGTIRPLVAENEVQPQMRRASEASTKIRVILSWIARITVAAILAQTLYFKFTYAPETQVIFADLGGRPAATVVGIIELVCVVLLLFTRTASIGALLSLFTISGAIVAHLTRLGIQIVNPQTGDGDGGLLFILALTIAFGSLTVLILNARQRYRTRDWRSGDGV